MYSPLPPPPPLNPFPHLVEVLDKAVRADLESLRFSYFAKLLVFTGFVFVGLGLEIGEIWHDVVGFFWRRRIASEYEASPALIREKREPSHKIKMFAAVGWLLIVTGVGGEGYFEGFVSWTDSTLQTFNNILLEAAHREAGDAAQSADKANKDLAKAEARLKAVNHEADVLSARLGELNMQLNAITPRAVILRNAEEEIRKSVSSFSGQKFVTRICGTPGNDVREQEKLDTKRALVDVLTLNGANWTYWGKQSGYWTKCGVLRQEGIAVLVNSDGPLKTIEAAQALAKELASILPSQMRDPFEQHDTKTWSSEDNEFPGATVNRFPDTIGILIGAMPLANTVKKQQNSRTNGKP